MKNLVLAAAVFLIVPALRAQQTEAKDNSPQVIPQENHDNSTVPVNSPEAIKTGHPLDPADVDILTGKRDRETELSRRANSVLVGGYEGYAGALETGAKRYGALDFPLLPLRRIERPFFFFNVSPGGFGPRRFGRR